MTPSPSVVASWSRSSSGTYVAGGPRRPTRARWSSELTPPPPALPPPPSPPTQSYVNAKQRVVAQSLVKSVGSRNAVIIHHGERDGDVYLLFDRQPEQLGYVQRDRNDQRYRDALSDAHAYRRSYDDSFANSGGERIPHRLGLPHCRRNIKRELRRDAFD